MYFRRSNPRVHCTPKEGMDRCVNSHVSKTIFIEIHAYNLCNTSKFDYRKCVAKVHLGSFASI